MEGLKRGFLQCEARTVRKNKTINLEISEGNYEDVQSIPTAMCYAIFE